MLHVIKAPPVTFKSIKTKFEVLDRDFVICLVLSRFVFAQVTYKKDVFFFYYLSPIGQVFFKIDLSHPRVQGQ